MKNLLILAMLTIFLFACKDEGAAGPMGETEYTLEQIENDTNWVEIIDYELLEIPCLKVHELDEKYYFKNNEDYQELSNYFYDYSSCTFNTLPEVDFDEEEVIGVSFGDSPLRDNDEFKLKVFFNSKENMLLAYCETRYYPVSNDIGRNADGYLFRKWIKKSKQSLINEIKLIHVSRLME